VKATRDDAWLLNLLPRVLVFEYFSKVGGIAGEQDENLPMVIAAISFIFPR